ncbi:Atr14 [Stachybotrys chlorohalonatus IBT 40285]|uniref:Cytochrome P450 monooxygenase ATR14 n=1 Tax=Stachybotrys chlorohalonatus (strain IBT 40285) TaxID=1283841 RepID=ATR14_STAC4|nr:RecName: Full=Cytochrome P450 monooxygenase ATR14; AltName: Full=Core atranone cluster (CAC) protein 14 [Stachybotrys chlorohalonata IBT 40285]KFA70077.1 Atr14 [Stachybotrys chlorohalonata IBT 40285]
MNVADIAMDLFRGAKGETISIFAIAKVTVTGVSRGLSKLVFGVVDQANLVNLGQYVVYSVVSMIYNITLHPLASFPGPVFWGASRWPSIWRLFKGRLVHDVHALHGQYGHVVRIAPNELAFSSAQAWKDIYGHKRGNNSMEEMPKFHKFYSGISKTPSIVSEPTRDGHRFIRRILSPAFSDKNLRELEPIVQGYISQFIDQLRSHCEDSTGSKVPLDLVSWYNSATFDIVGDLTFGRPFGSLEQGEEDPFIKDINHFAAVGGAMLIFTSHFPGRGILRFLASLGKVFQNGQEKHVTKMEESLVDRMKNKSSRPDIIDGLVKEKDGFQIDYDRVLENAAAITMAGSETTASQLSGLTALLLQNPNCLERLKKEVRSAFKSDKDITSTSSLVGVWQYSANHSPRNFTYPDEFRPDRWLDDRDQKEYEHDHGDAMQPFSVGPRDCPSQK